MTNYKQIKNLEGHTTADFLLEVYSNSSKREKSILESVPFRKLHKQSRKIVEQNQDQEDQELSQALSDIAKDPQSRNKLIRTLNTSGTKQDNDPEMEKTLKDLGLEEGENIMAKMPQSLRKTLKTFQVNENDFSNAIQRKLREARECLSESKYQSYKEQMVERIHESPKKFVAYMGATDKKLKEGYPQFKKVAKKLRESKKKNR